MENAPSTAQTATITKLDLEESVNELRAIAYMVGAIGNDICEGGAPSDGSGTEAFCIIGNRIREIANYLAKDVFEKEG